MKSHSLDENMARKNVKSHTLDENVVRKMRTCIRSYGWGFKDEF